jgi:agmatine deiminase
MNAAGLHREWDGATIRKIKRDLSKVIQTIARYEAVRVLAHRCLGYREARREFCRCPNVSVVQAPVDDFWMRNIMPTFALRSSDGLQEIVAIDSNFNGWGGARATL